MFHGSRSNDRWQPDAVIHGLDPRMVGYYPGQLANSRPRRGRIDEQGRL